MRTEISDDHTEATIIFDSVDEFARMAATKEDAVEIHYDPEWYGGIRTFKEALEYARVGWQREEDKALTIAERAIETVEREHEVDTFAPYWDTAGAEVDVARYLDGEPECMIDYHISPVTKVGRVITLCASVCYSGSINGDTIKKRGHSIAALAMALNSLGFQVELWADMSIADGGGFFGPAQHYARLRVQVKGANDELDPARIMYAYSHPSFFRMLGFAGFNLHSKLIKRECGVPHGGYGFPAAPKADLPEGTIYLPEILSEHDIPDADQMLRDHMRELGIIE